MIRTISTAIAASALLLLGGGIASASPEIAAQCARATIPTPLCNGGGVGNPTDGTSGRVQVINHGKYYSGNGAPVVVGYDKNSPVVDENGDPVLDDNGNPTYEPIMAAGDPIFTAYPDVKAGDKDSGGNTVVDLSGYQHK